MNIIKNTAKLLLLTILIGAIGCSDEIVPIYETDRSGLDSLNVLIETITEEKTAAQITEKELQRRLDSLNTALGKIAPTSTTLKPDVHYTIQVADGSASYVNGRVASLADAVVTVSQGNEAQEVTTDVTGFATFPKLESGFISVTVEIAGFSDLYMIVDLRDGGADSDATNSETRYASTQAIVFPTSGSSMFTMSGVSYYNQDLDNLRADTQDDPAHPYTGLDIYETVPADVQFIIDCVPAVIPNNTTRAGKIIQVVYAGLSRVATTDADGAWSMEIPSVLQTNGSNFFSYTGPIPKGTFIATQVSSTTSVTYVWGPSVVYPTPLNEILIYPGGNSNQDIYYFPF